MTEDKEEALLFVFRLPGGEKERAIKLRGLGNDTAYSISYMDNDQCLVKSSRELTEEGLLFNSMEEKSSEILLLKKE